MLGPDIEAWDKIVIRGIENTVSCSFEVFVRSDFTRTKYYP